MFALLVQNPAEICFNVLIVLSRGNWPNHAYSIQVLTGPTGAYVFLLGFAWKYSILVMQNCEIADDATPSGQPSLIATWYLPGASIDHASHFEVGPSASI